MAGLATHSGVASNMSIALSLGGYTARIGGDAATQAAAQGLRALCFRAGDRDDDAFDAVSSHGIVTRKSGQLVLAFRLRLLTPHDLPQSYTGTFYDLSPLARTAGPFLELGRLCHKPGAADPNAARLAWAAIGQLADRHNVSMLIGCSSFPGADPGQHTALLAVLRKRYLGPPELRPRRKSDLAVVLPNAPLTRATLPNLLRLYLNMGGWVGDHAVRDPDLDTLHVFTGLAVSEIPEARKQRLRSLAMAAAP